MKNKFDLACMDPTFVAFMQEFTETANYYVAVASSSGSKAMDLNLCLAYAYLAGFEAGRESVRAAIEAVNTVQNLIAPFQSNSSEILSPIKQAWNINARFLSDNFQLQTEYLKRLKENP